jgi:hypothetical protein
LAHRAGMLRLRWQGRPAEFGQRRAIIIRQQAATIRVSPGAIIPVTVEVTRGILTTIPRLITHHMAEGVSTTVKATDQPLGYAGRLLFKSLVIYT